MSSSDGSVSVPAAAPPSPLMQEGSPEIRFLASPSSGVPELVWIRVMISVGNRPSARYFRLLGPGGRGSRGVPNTYVLCSMDTYQGGRGKTG